MSERITAADYQAMQKGKTKPVKQFQGSNKGKAPPITEVSTTRLKLTKTAYSEDKQDILKLIQDLYNERNASLELISKDDPQKDNKVNAELAVMRKCKFAEEIIKLLDI